MAEPHAHSQPILTYGPAPTNTNIWPHNSRATVFCLRFWPLLLFFKSQYTHYCYTYIHAYMHEFIHKNKPPIITSAASIWFEIWGSWIRVKKFDFLGKFRCF